MPCLNVNVIVVAMVTVTIQQLLWIYVWHFHVEKGFICKSYFWEKKNLKTGEPWTNLPVLLLHKINFLKSTRSSLNADISCNTIYIIQGTKRISEGQYLEVGGALKWGNLP